jgi:biotin synthase
MTASELRAIYETPFFDLLSRARSVFLEHWSGDEMQLCTLLSIKTGGCSEDCGYCSQSAHHPSAVQSEPLMEARRVFEAAQQAVANGSTRFCMGAAWKGVKDGDKKFETVLDTVRQVASLGIEVCVTLGQLGPVEARKLKEAGVTAYNHNIDTSPEFYAQVVSTHTFDDRLQTIQAVQQAGMDVCCGGILGMGETVEDRLRMLEVLTEFNPPPESVPINSLMAMPGTPMAEQTPIDVFDLVRMIATTRIALPKSKVRLSAGRSRLSKEAQALCFYAGANSVFYGEKLLTADNPGVNEDRELLEQLDLVPLAPHAGTTA